MIKVYKFKFHLINSILVLGLFSVAFTATASSVQIKKVEQIFLVYLLFLDNL